MEQNSDYKKLVSILEEACVCKRCILRFCGVQEYTSYILKEDVDQKMRDLLTQPEQAGEDVQSSLCEEKKILPDAKRLQRLPCAACLGFLQDACDMMTAKITEAVNAQQYVFKDFVLQVSIPAVVDLRDKLFCSFLKEKLGESHVLVGSNIPTVKDICKWVIGPQFGRLTSLDFTPESSFQIILSSSYSNTVKECQVLLKMAPTAFPNARKIRATDEKIYSRSAILRAIEELSSSLKDLFSLPPLSPDKPCFFEEVVFSRSPLYLGGRYNKYSRELSQTPWFLEGERRMDSSVNELITDVVSKFIISDKIVFSASGREDVDVKMLGNGRPFVLEILNPKRIEWSFQEMKHIEDEINAGTKLIAVHHLQVISKNEISLLKEGEELKRKSYSAVCIVEKTLTEKDLEILNNLKDLKLSQKTPIRVLHRRTLSTREKILHHIEAKIVSDHRLDLKVETQAGTYVKEFVHGDFGRTIPNLGTLLGTNADILQLDVEVMKFGYKHGNIVGQILEKEFRYLPLLITSLK